MTRPEINVTPLIDVLLVLLIIFMVVTPLKPSAFHARIPAEPEKAADPRVNPQILVVSIGRNMGLSLNGQSGLGTVSDPSLMISRLTNVFRLRVASADVSPAFGGAPDRKFDDRVERTVFIKAPRTTDYGSVARVVDAVKLAGAFPISLQIDDLN